jgi:endonuclease YncB( thermonuclease family)
MISPRRLCESIHRCENGVRSAHELAERLRRVWAWICPHPVTRIRLWGIDAPESSQLCRGDDSLQYRCGAKAANDLDAFIASRPVSCNPISLDRYRRTVATCSVGGVDIGEWLVRNGLALDWPQYSKRKFDSVRREAVHAGRGMWAGSYVEPWLYRVCIRAGGSPSNCSDDANTHP